MTTHLPIATQFCSAEVELLSGGTFFVDGNSKITGANGTYSEPKPNAFSLPAASISLGDGHCPGSTPTCRASCYVQGLAKHAPDLYARYEQNAVALRKALSTSLGTVSSAAALALWIRREARAGFRWHVSGDVWNEEHASWIVQVCKAAHDVPFWIYTRTLEVVPLLTKASNLAVNVSADADNYVHAVDAVIASDARLCYMASGDGYVPPLEHGDVIFPDYALRGRDLAEPTSAPWWQGLTHAQRVMVCPADFFGQSEAHRCGPCRKCLDTE